ncbi:MAG TPA: pyrimidine/purine nucleoside phosphorylase [Spirochaetota bacterium]|nr:pyrimidine/purine nucleoside phosphorylase [Spirochaetota bacterium]HOR45329.1 pyrimidine/purine nucleoside phosphorylase [Spirochaetota bacterium]HPK57049.1 pyrimidine/purine nucleoside phosphorylase [Spirochaetota bacterium]HQE60467.1 pyrimidine/purine nucleoside phosphorylase [Spirochaetota bacterium]
MLKVNEYFDGKVKSVAFSNSEGKATSGVISRGTYEFSTSSEELMKVTSGKLNVLMGDHSGVYSTGESFVVPANSKFTVTADEECSYVCFYK